MALGDGFGGEQDGTRLMIARIILRRRRASPSAGRRGARRSGRRSPRASSRFVQVRGSARRRPSAATIAAVVRVRSRTRCLHDRPRSRPPDPLRLRPSFSRPAPPRRPSRRRTPPGWRVAGSLPQLGEDVRRGSRGARATPAAFFSLPSAACFGRKSATAAAMTTTSARSANLEHAPHASPPPW